LPRSEYRSCCRRPVASRLFDVASSEVVWSVATTTVTNRGNVPAMIDQFVQLIVDTLKKDSLI